MIPLKPKRPASVTILAAGVLIIAGLALLRFAAAIQQWAFLASLPGYLPLYIVISGLTWGVVVGWLFWGLWQASPWAPRLARVALPLYAAFYWFDRLLMSNRQANSIVQIPENASFALLITIVSLVFCYWALSRTRSIIYFGDRHERTS
jgi:hypothetical protein